jgi:voltage-gated sodium channel
VSVAVMLTLFTMNLIFGLGATMLFSDLPNHEKYFGDPVTSTYSLFKVFTVEGWYDVPDELADSDELGKEGRNPLFWKFVLRGYFVVAVIVGGIIGLSLANAVFVNEVTAGNTDRLEVMLGVLREEIDRFRSEEKRDRAEAIERLQAELLRTRQLIEQISQRLPGR